MKSSCLCFSSAGMTKLGSSWSDLSEFYIFSDISVVACLLSICTAKVITEEGVSVEEMPPRNPAIRCFLNY